MEDISKRWTIDVDKLRAVPNTGFLAFGLRACYIPCKFSHGICLALYTPPCDDEAARDEQIHPVVSEVITDRSNAFRAIFWRFSIIRLSPSTLKGFSQ